MSKNFNRGVYYILKKNKLIKHVACDQTRTCLTIK